MAEWYFVLGVLAIVFILIAVSVIMRRFVSNVEDYYVSGRRVPWIMFVGTTTATWLSMWTLMGGAGLVTTWGPFPVTSYFLGSVAGLVLLTLYVGPAIRRARFVTIPDFFEDRFGSKRVRAASTIALIVALYFYIVLQITGGTIVLEVVLGIPYFYAMIAFLVILVLSLIFSGMWSVVVNDAFGWIMFTVAAIFIPITLVSMSGGLESGYSQLLESQGPEFFTLAGKSGMTTGQIIGNIISWIIILGSAPHLINRALLVRSDKDVIKGGIGTMIAGFVVIFFLYIGFSMVPNLMDVSGIEPDFVPATAAVQIFPPVLGVLYLMGAFAAGVTTANAQFLTCAQGLARDIYQKLINPRISEERLMTVTYSCIIGLALLAILTTLLRPLFLVDLGTVSGMILAFGYFPVITLGLIWGRITAKAAEIVLWLSIPLGLFAVITWTFLDWFQPHPTIYGVIFGFAALLILTFITEHSGPEKEAWDRLKVNLWPGKRYMLIEKTDIPFAIGAALLGIIVTLIILGVYVGWWW